MGPGRPITSSKLTTCCGRALQFDEVEEVLGTKERAADWFKARRTHISLLAYRCF